MLKATISSPTESPTISTASMPVVYTISASSSNVMLSILFYFQIALRKEASRNDDETGEKLARAIFAPMTRGVGPWY